MTLCADTEAQIYLPTVAMQLLETLASARPNHRLIAADFDALPDVKLPGVNGPLVASMVCLLLAARACSSHASVAAFLRFVSSCTWLAGCLALGMRHA